MLIPLKHNQKQLARGVCRCLRSSAESRRLPAAASTRIVLFLTTIAFASLLTSASSAAQRNQQEWTGQKSSRSEQPVQTHRPSASHSDDLLDEGSAVPEPTSLFSESRSHSAREEQVIPASYTAAADVDGDMPVAEPFLDLKIEESPVSSRNAETETADSTESIVRILSTCIILGCCAILILLGLRKWQRSRGLLPGSGGRSRVIETLSLGPGRTVSLIEMDGLRALVGADAGGIRTIVMAPRAFSEEMAESQALESGSMSI